MSFNSAKDKEEFNAILSEVGNTTLMQDIEKYYQEMNRILKELNDEEVIYQYYR